MQKILVLLYFFVKSMFSKVTHFTLLTHFTPLYPITYKESPNAISHAHRRSATNVDYTSRMNKKKIQPGLNALTRVIAHTSLRLDEIDRM